MERQLRKNWMVGFFGLFALFAIPGIIKGDWTQAIWLVWVLWFLYFIPIRRGGEK